KTPAGRALFWDRLDKDTWRVATGRNERVTVEFDYLADTIDLSSARIVGEFGQFLGTNLFMFEEGQLQRPGEVRFSLPAGWQVTTALKSAGGGVYTAPSYHELVDAETFVGKYSLDSLQVDGRWIRIAVWPADADPPRGDVAVRLPRGAVHAAVVVVGGRDRLLLRSDEHPLRAVDGRPVPEQCCARHAAGRVGARAVERRRRERRDVDQRGVREQ